MVVTYMANFKDITTDSYGYLLGNNYYPFKKVNNIYDCCKKFLQIIMQKEENEPVVLPNGKISIKQTLQNYINDYGVVTFENMDSDGTTYTETTVGVGEVMDHLQNTYHWIIVNNSSIQPMLALRVLEQIAQDWEMKDYVKP